MLFLASLPGVLEQRDGRRDTALGVARRRRHTAIEELLLEAGAKPEHASYQDPASSGREAGAGVGAAAAEGEEEYSSWTPAERRSYCHGGEGGSGRGGAPPGLQPHGRGSGFGGSWGRGRGRSAAAAAVAAPGSGLQAAPDQHQEPPKPHCPW